MHNHMFSNYYFFLIIIIIVFLLPVICFQIFLSITSNFQNRSIDGTIIDTSTPSQSGPGSNGNKEVHPTPQKSRTRASPSDVVWCHAKEILPF